MRKIFTVLMLLLFSIFSVNAAKADEFEETMSRINFIPQNVVNQTDIGLEIQFIRPIISILFNSNYPTSGYVSDNRVSIASIAGVGVTLENVTDQIIIIHWGKSNISIGDDSVVPFIDGMKYVDAGNPSATPDTLVPPHKTIPKVIYSAYPKFNDGDWSSFDTGIPVPENDKISGTLYLNVQIGNNEPQYITVPIPNIGVDQSQKTRVNSNNDSPTNWSGLKYDDYKISV